MNELVPIRPGIVVPHTPTRLPARRNVSIEPSTPEAIEKVNRLTVAMRERLPAVPFVTEHLLHGGQYLRTVRLPANTLVAAVLFKRATSLIISGACTVYSNDELIEVNGPHVVVPCAAGRKIALITRSELQATMSFPSDAKDVETAQKEFTDEYDQLPPLSHEWEHVVTITGA
jgi:hypothetical protein